MISPRLLRLGTLIWLLAAATACFNLPTSAPARPAIEADVAEREADSLALDVVDFDWAYLNGGVYLRISGSARNNTGAPIQGVTLLGAVYDEAGRPVGLAESYLAPTYLPAGAVGNFEFTVMPSRTRGIRNLRLETRARVLQ